VISPDQSGVLGQPVDSSLTTVGSYSSAIEAHAAKNFLEAHGIGAFVADEHTATEGWSNFSETNVQVASSQAIRAHELLASAR
jgi:hypothetical protein